MLRKAIAKIALADGVRNRLRAEWFPLNLGFGTCAREGKLIESHEAATCENEAHTTPIGRRPPSLIASIGEATRAISLHKANTGIVSLDAITPPPHNCVDHATTKASATRTIDPVNTSAQCTRLTVYQQISLAAVVARACSESERTFHQLYTTDSLPVTFHTTFARSNLISSLLAQIAGQLHKNDARRIDFVSQGKLPSDGYQRSASTQAQFGARVERRVAVSEHGRIDEVQSFGPPQWSLLGMVTRSFNSVLHLHCLKDIELLLWARVTSEDTKSKNSTSCKPVRVVQSLRYRGRLSAESECRKKQCPVGDASICGVSNCVYRVTCLLCERHYVGYTTRQLHDRVAEHCRPNSRSSVAKHYAKHHPNENMKLALEILDQREDREQLRHAEAMHIMWQKPSLNRRKERLYLTYVFQTS